MLHLLGFPDMGLAGMLLSGGICLFHHISYDFHIYYILLNDFACRETRLHNADWFKRMITLGSIQRYAV